jgi:sigma-B regulation protein RsbU (phosphoserine phosphatase)
MHSLAAAPVFDNGKVNYMVVLMRREPAAFSTDELATLVLTTNLIGKATSHLILSAELERAYATLDREFRAVGAIQRELLPKKLPEIPGVRFAVHYETSTRAGGDYYDFFPLADGSWGILIADVSGHGPAAAVIVAMIHTMMKLPMYMCPQEMPSPVQGLDFLNRELVRSTSPGQFVTAWLGVFDPKSRVLRYANAGHNAPRWLRAADHKVIALEPGDGMPLAIDAEFETSELNVKLERGDRLLLYTDGITETFNTQRQMFGTEGLDAVLGCCSRTPEGLIAAVRDEVNGFAFGAPAADDRTLVAMALD